MPRPYRFFRALRTVRRRFSPRAFQSGLPGGSQTQDLACWPKPGWRRPRTGPSKRVVAVLHQQDHRWNDRFDLTSFTACSSHQFPMLHSRNLPLAHIICCTIVTPSPCRSKAATVGAVLLERTGSYASTGESVEGETAVDHQTMQSVVCR
jgi:hypothetical protein